MKKNIVAFMVLISLLFAFSDTPVNAQVLVHDAQVMENVLEHYCRDTALYGVSCGIYQNDIVYAQQRAASIRTRIAAASGQEKRVLVEGLLERVARSFYTATDTRQKLISAWYYVYFTSGGQQNSSTVKEYIDYLFDYQSTDPLFTVTNPNIYGEKRGSSQPSYVVSTTVRPLTAVQSGFSSRPSYARYNGSSYRYPTRSTNYGRVSRLGITAIRPLSSNNSIDSRGNTIYARSSRKDIDISIATRTSGGTVATRNNGYRVVATTRKTGSTVYAANSRTNGEWELRLRPGTTSIDDITIYLLCSRCSGTGTTFSQGRNYNGRTIVDSKTLFVRRH